MTAGSQSCAKFESEEGKEILKSLGIEGDYEGIGHCVLSYAQITRSQKPHREKIPMYIM